jgi:DNA-binding MarR family transcriptional regulator
MATSKLTLSEFLPYQLSITSNAVSDLIARSYQGRFGLKIPEWRVMAVLGERASVTQRDLVAATAMDKVTVNRASKALVERGLLGRAPNETDGRSHHLALTAVGRELYDQIVPLALSVEAELETVLTGDEAKVLAGMLERLRTKAGNIDL